MLINLLLAVSVFALVMIFLLLPGESSAEMRAPFWGVNHAHRGLHSSDKSVPENSLAAFTAAVDGGFGIELDIQLTKDEEVVVFHDDDLKRVCGVDGRVDSYTYEELRQFRLHDTDQHIPLLTEVLDVVDSRVPMIIELKTGPRNRLLCQRAWRILRQYDGDICVESFDPRIVRWFKRHVPGLLRGQLAAAPSVLGGATGFVLGFNLANFLGRPHFIAYGKGKKPLLTRLCQHFAMSIVWTVQPNDDTEALEDDNDAVIFEFYDPLPRYADPPFESTNLPEEDEFR